VPLSVLAASTAVAGKPPADRGSASRALPAATMSEAIRGRDFFGAEGGGETKYEVSHVVGKGSYGIVWCELQRPGCATAMNGSSTIAEHRTYRSNSDRISAYGSRTSAPAPDFGRTTKYGWISITELQNTAGFI
jgi:hypothetical protein